MSIKSLVINVIGLAGAVLGGMVGLDGHGPVGAAIGAVLGYFMSIVGVTLLLQFMFGAFAALSVLFILFVIMGILKGLG